MQAKRADGAVQEHVMALALVPYFAWVLCVRCSPMLFVGASSTRPSYLFLVALTAGLAGSMGVWRLCVSHRGPKLGASALPALWFLGCASGAAGTLACLLPGVAGLPSFGAAVAVGILVGLSYGVTLIYGVHGCRAVGPGAFMRVMAWALGGALVVLVALCAWVPMRWLALAGLLPLVSGWLGRRWAAVSAGPVIAGAPQGRVRALLGCAGFFAAFVVGMHPKSAHLPWMVESVAYVGTLSSRSLIYLLVYGALLLLFAYGMSRAAKNSGPTLVMVALVLAYAVMFFTLPFMKELNIPSCLNNALSLLFVTLAVPLLASMDSRAAATGAVFLGGGAWGAALAAAVFMGPLFNVLPHQDEVFVALPFVVSLAVLVLGVTLGPWLRRVLLPVSSGAAGDEGTTYGESGVRDTPAPPDAPAWRALAAAWGLTTRETQVFELIVQGRNEPYMSDHLCISRATVKTHVNHIYKKAGVLSRQELLDRVHGEG